MVLSLCYYGNKILRTRAQPVEKITDELKQLVKDMIETMDASQGIGLAAPQIGHSIRLFVLRNYVETPGEEIILSPPRVYINPKLSKPGLEKLTDTEGCLSLPGIRAEVERPSKITVEAMDLDGNMFVEEVEGYNARVRMHENDHLNGILFTDRLNLRGKKKVAPLLKHIEEKYKIEPESA